MIALYVIFLLLLSIFFYAHLVKYRSIRNLPGPSMFSLLSGIFRSPSSSEIFISMANLNQIYGPVVKFWSSPFKPELIVTNTKYVEYLLTSTIHLNKSDFYDLFQPYIGAGLATSTTFLWKHERKQLNSAFRNKILDTYFSTFEKLGNELVISLYQDINHNFVNLLPIILKYTMSVICGTIMNITEGFSEKTIIEYTKALDEYISIMAERNISFIGQNQYMFKFTKAYRKHIRNVKFLREFSLKIVQKYARQMEKRKTHDAADVRNVIDLLLEMYDLDDKQLIDHICTFLGAGHDTSASVISFALYELSKYPEMQAKIIQESISIIGKNKDTEMTIPQAQQMNYLDCVIKETLRLYAPIPFIARKTHTNAIIDGTYIPKGTDVTISIFNVHRSEEYHQNPKKFDPDRFLPENIEKLKPFTFLPFSLGPRNCLGKPFAMLEMKSVITKVLRHFELHPVEGQPELKLYSGFVLKSVTGLQVKLKPRKM